MKINMFKSADEFHEWFSGSAVQKDGLPLIQFHGTPYPLYNEPFWRFSHFGTANCSHSFIWNAIKNHKTASLYPVSLAIKSPLKMKDIGHHGASHLADALADLGVFSNQENQEAQKRSQPIATNPKGIFSRYKAAQNNPDALSSHRNNIRENADFAHSAFETTHAPHAYHAFLGYEFICDLLNQKGYDGIIYENHREDDGSPSWAITRSDQTVSMFELQKLGIPYVLEYDSASKSLEPPYWLPDLNAPS